MNTKRFWHSVLVAAVALTAIKTGVVAAPLETNSQSELLAPGASPDSYELFLYLRHNPTDGLALTDSLMLVRVTRDGFDAKPVYSERNLNIGWHPLGVRNGKLYAVTMGELITVDLNKGRKEQVDSGLKSWTWSDGKLYAFVQKESSSMATLLRVYDTETESYRDIGVPPHPPEGIYWESWPPQPRVSPDHKWLAYFFRSTNFMDSYMHRLILVTTDGGSTKTSRISVAARQFLTGSSLGFVTDGPPFCWLDSKTLLVVRDVSTNHPSMSWDNSEEAMADMILSRTDADTDRITDICPLPRFQPGSGEPFFRTGRTGEVPRIVIGRLGQYRIDLDGQRLIRDADIGGGYSYTKGNSADQPDELRFKDRVLENEMVVQEIAVSPDGRRVAWHATPIIRPSDDSKASTIWFHDAPSGAIRSLTSQWIPAANLIWISTRDLTPTNPTNAPAGWKPFSAKPHVR